MAAQLIMGPCDGAETEADVTNNWVYVPVQTKPPFTWFHCYSRIDLSSFGYAGYVHVDQEERDE